MGNPGCGCPGSMAKIPLETVIVGIGGNRRN